MGRWRHLQEMGQAMWPRLGPTRPSRYSWACTAPCAWHQRGWGSPAWRWSRWEGSSDREFPGSTPRPPAQRGTHRDPQPSPALPSCLQAPLSVHCSGSGRAPLPCPHGLGASPGWGLERGLRAGMPQGLVAPWGQSMRVCWMDKQAAPSPTHTGPSANPPWKSPTAPPGTRWAPAKDGKLMWSAESRLAGLLPRVQPQPSRLRGSRPAHAWLRSSPPAPPPPQYKPRCRRKQPPRPRDPRSSVNRQRPGFFFSLGRTA